MTTVTAGSSGGFTLPALQDITISPAANGVATFEVRRAGVVIAGDRVTSSRTVGAFKAGDVFVLTAQRGNVDYVAGPSGPFAFDGYIGQITPGNFGVNSIRYPLNWDGVTTGAAAQTGVTSHLAKAVQPGNWVRIFLGFSANGRGGSGDGSATGLFGSGNATINSSRLAEWQYAIGALHDAGLKVLVVLEGVVPLDATAMGLYRDRLGALLRSLPLSTDRQSTYIDAFEPSNEIAEQSGITHVRAAEMMRVTFTLFRAYSPQTIVLSPSYVGGETLGSNDVLRLLAASAAGVTVLGDGGGTGTTGEQFCDAIAYHPYPENVGTVALALAALNDTSAQLRVRDFMDPIRAAITTRRALNPTYWNGRADPEVWATEYNINPNGGLATTNSSFRMQAFTPSERGLLIEQMVFAAFACGANKVFPYAVDHQFVQGPIGQMTCSLVGGELRMDTSSAGSTPVLDGDAIFVSDGGGWSVAYHATESGVLSTARGIPSDGTSNQYYQVTAYRWQLGGWAEQYRAIQAKFIGYAEMGWSGAGASAVPQRRISTEAAA